MCLQVPQVVPQLLTKDPTYLMLPKVFWFVVRHRQNLLPSLTSIAAATSAAAPSSSTAPQARARRLHAPSASAASVLRQRSPLHLNAWSSRTSPLPLLSQSILNASLSQAVEPVKGLFTGGTPSGMVVTGEARRAMRNAKRVVRPRKAKARGGGRGGARGGGAVRRCGGGGGGGGGAPRPNLGGWSRSGVNTSLWCVLSAPHASCSLPGRLAPCSLRDAAARILREQPHSDARPPTPTEPRSPLLRVPVCDALLTVTRRACRLGTPSLSLRTASRLSPAAQQALGHELVAALMSKGTLDVSVVRRLVKKLAALPALPALHLLRLLEATQAPAAPAAGAGAAAEAGAGGDSREAVQDVVLSALVNLDDSSQVWGWVGWVGGRVRSFCAFLRGGFQR